MKPVAVFGASGRQGMAQVRQLIAVGYRVRALSRSADPFYGAQFEGVEIVSADISDDRTLAAALEGVDGVFYTHPVRNNAGLVETIERIGRAAKQANAGRLIWNTSSWIPDQPGDPGIYGRYIHAINALWRTGAPATVFGPVLFMDNLLTNWAFPFIVREGRYVYPHRATLAANWISLDDLARFMIAALDRPDLEGAWMNIGGPERLLPGEVAQILSEAVGAPIRFDPCTPQEFGWLLVDAFGDIPAEHRAATAKEFGDFYSYMNSTPLKPFEVNVEYMLERVPIRLETMREWASRQEWRITDAPRPSGG